MRNKKLNLNVLIEMKNLIKKGKFDLIGRKRNLESLAIAGLSLAEMKYYVENLEEADFIEMRKDRDRKGKLYIFKKDIGNIKFYIKLKPDMVNNRKIVKILSFHIDYM